MAKKKTASLIGFILLAVAILGAVLSVVGVFIDWVKYTAETILGNNAASYTLKKLAESNAELKKVGDGMEMFDAMNAFAYITMILSVISAAAVLLTKFFEDQTVKARRGAGGRSDDRFHDSHDRFRMYVLLQERGLLVRQYRERQFWLGGGRCACHYRRISCGTQRNGFL